MLKNKYVRAVLMTMAAIGVFLSLILGTFATGASKWGFVLVSAVCVSGYFQLNKDLRRNWRLTALVSSLTTLIVLQNIDVFGMIEFAVIAMFFGSVFGFLDDPIIERYTAPTVVLICNVIIFIGEMILRPIVYLF